MIGRALAASLRDDGHQVLRLVRSPGVAAEERDAIYWNPAEDALEPSHLDGIDAAVNLAGAGIADRRWSEKRKREVLESRTRSTDLLSRALAKLDQPPAVLVSGSGLHYYGNSGDEILTEDSPAGVGKGFLPDVVSAWEAATSPAEAAGIRVVHARTSVVLSRSGGMLPKLLLPFKLGLGGRIGSGDQWMSWITLGDDVRAIRFLLDTSSISGPVNMAAPQPVTNRAFTKALGRALHRPTAIPTPVSGLGLARGRQLVSELMLDSLRARPAVLSEAGFSFKHPDIDTALEAVLGG